LSWANTEIFSVITQSLDVSSGDCKQWRSSEQEKLSVDHLYSVAEPADDLNVTESVREGLQPENDITRDFALDAPAAVATLKAATLTPVSLRKVRRASLWSVVCASPW
jgi:hypothetical protein